MSNLQGPVVVTGRINRAVYQSLKHHIMSPIVKLVMFGMLAVYDVWLIWQMIAEKNPAYLLLVAIFSGATIACYFFAERSALKRAVNSRREIAKGDGLELTLTFTADRIMLFNHTLGSERELPYANFVSRAESDKCIALFVNGGNYLMIPKQNMDAHLYDQVNEIIHTKCPKLHKRL